MAKVIAVHSYRGGTGKSHFTANLATQIALLGYRVAVIDTDLPSPGIHHLLGLDLDHVQRTLNHYLWGECGIGEVAYNVGTNIGIAQPGAVFLVPGSIKPDHIARILKDGFDVKRLNDGLRELMAQLKLDYLFIDTHPGLSKETFLSIAISHAVILVLRPDKQDYQGTAVTVDVARQLKVRKLMLAVNKAHAQLDHDALRAKVEEAYAAPVIGVFPLSEDVAQVASDGVFSLRRPDHPISRLMGQLARHVVQEAA